MVRQIATIQNKTANSVVLLAVSRHCSEAENGRNGPLADIAAALAHRRFAAPVANHPDYRPVMEARSKLGRDRDPQRESSDADSIRL